MNTLADYAVEYLGAVLENVDDVPLVEHEYCCAEYEALVEMSNGMFDVAEDAEEYERMCRHADHVALRREMAAHECEKEVVQNEEYRLADNRVNSQEYFKDVDAGGRIRLQTRIDELPRPDVTDCTQNRDDLSRLERPDIARGLLDTLGDSELGRKYREALRGV